MREKYIVPYSYTLDGLIMQVNEYIKKGYVPLGGIAIQPKVTGERFYQALYIPEVDPV